MTSGLDIQTVPVEVRMEVRQVQALERIATALEQMALDRMPVSLSALVESTVEPPWPTQAPADLPPTAPSAPLTPTVTVPLPPVTPPFTFTPNLACPIHHLAWKIVPAGVSKKSGRAYAAFAVCPESGCEQRPPQ